MPVSEDELPLQVGGHQSGLSKAEQRKSNKPIMEKRRRARINHCLNELKTLILDAMKKDPARHSKLEKADILEMTVKHLQQIQRQQLATAVATDPSVLMRFKSGFDECAAEVNRYISRLEGVDSGVKQRLAAHLHRCVSSIQQVSTFPHQNVFSALAQNCDKTTLVLPNVPSVPGDVNNNSNQPTTDRIQIPSGLHLIPSRLPTGELALLVPNSNHMTTFLNAPQSATFQFPHNITMSSILSPTLGGNMANHASAFTAVIKGQEYPSPTSTADVIKKEPPMDNEHFQNYSPSFKVTTEIKDEGSEKGSQEGNRYTFGLENKISQRTGASFQRTVADSTTSFLQAKDHEIQEFKPFQVDIPNSRLKAHISISDHSDDIKQIHQKPNPNYTLNPNRVYQKSPHKSRTAADSFPGKFDLAQPLSIVTKTEKIQDSQRAADSSSSEMFQKNEGTPKFCRKAVKRPLSAESPEIASSSSSESPGKAPRISLNVTLTEDQSKDDQTCKRISVIVEDSSKSNGREGKSEVTVNVSAQKDMWRPW